MQSIDRNDKVVDTSILDFIHDAREIKDRIQKARAMGAVRHTISELPNKGETVELRGLKFYVAGVNHDTGELHLRIVTPE